MVKSLRQNEGQRILELHYDWSSLTVLEYMRGNFLEAAMMHPLRAFHANDFQLLS